MDSRYGAYYAAFYGAGEPVQVPFLARVAERFGLGNGLRVLDIGCGTGRHLRAMASLGWQVVGMDPQPENLAEARRAAGAAPGVVDVVEGGFADLDAVAAFDMVTAMGNPWWYLLTPGERADSLRRVRRALRPGGVVVLDGANFEWILDHFREPPAAEAVVDGVLVRREATLDIDRVQRTWTHTDAFRAAGDDDELVMVHRMAIVSVDEVRAALGEAGFDPVEVYGSWDSTMPSMPAGSRIIAVGRTPGGTAIDKT